MRRRGILFVILNLTVGLLALSTTAGVAGEKWAPGEAAVAAAQKFFFHLGFAYVPYDVSSTSTLNGAPWTTAGIRLDPSYTATTEGGYFLTPNFAVAFSGGYPPTAISWGTGSVAGVALGQTTAGIITLNAQYHLTNFGAFVPYVGAGAAYLIVFNTEDRALTNFKVQNAFGANLQIGADWWMSKNVGVFVDIKKVFLSTKSSGLEGGVLPVNTTIRLDPTIYSVGLAVRY